MSARSGTSTGLDFGLVGSALSTPKKERKSIEDDDKSKGSKSSAKRPEPKANRHDTDDFMALFDTPRSSAKNTELGVSGAALSARSATSSVASSRPPSARSNLTAAAKERLDSQRGGGRRSGGSRGTGTQQRGGRGVGQRRPLRSNDRSPTSARSEVSDVSTLVASARDEPTTADEPEGGWLQRARNAAWREFDEQHGITAEETTTDDVSRSLLARELGIKRESTANSRPVRSSTRPAQNPTVGKETVTRGSIQQKRNKSSNLRPSSSPLADRNDAAVTLQRWFRKYLKRKRAGEAALRRMLTNQRRQMEESRGESLEEVRIKKKKEKEREARQQALEEYRRAKAEKAEEVKRVAEEEIQYLKESGKVGKKPAKTNRKPIAKKPEKPEKQGNSIKHPLDAKSGSDADSTPRDTGTTRDPVSSRATEVVSEAQSHTTLDDVLQMIQKLEEEEKFPTPRPSTADQVTGIASRLSVENLAQLAETQAETKPQSKLNDIMDFLENVEKESRFTEIGQQLDNLSTDRPNTATLSELEVPGLVVPSPEELAKMEAASVSASEVTSQMLSQRLALQERERSIATLKKALTQQRELTVRHARQAEVERTEELRSQKDEYETRLQRVYGIVDELSSSKKNLMEKVEKLASDLKRTDANYRDRIKQLEDRHSHEMSKLKEFHSATDKIKKEKWVEAHTKKIKEMTVKGLEPEIQRLIAKHKGEMAKVKQQQEAEILLADERASQRYIQQTEALRDQLADEKEAACARERELARKSYEQQLAHEMENYQQLKRKLHSEVAEERDRLEQQHTQKRLDLDRLQRELETRHSKAAAALREEYEKSRDQQQKRHEEELESLSTRLRSDKESYKTEVLREQDTWAAKRERELRQEMRKERDRDIETIVTQLEDDTRRTKDETERAATNRIRRMQEKHDAEMAEMEEQERQTQKKYTDNKARLTEVEGENSRLRVLLSQKDDELHELNSKLDRLQSERDRVSDVVRTEFADRIVATEEENKRIKRESAEQSARHKLELERAKGEVEVMERKKQNEIDELHTRVKQAVASKQENINQLRRQYDTVVKRAEHLEGLLDEQRKLVMGKK